MGESMLSPWVNSFKENAFFSWRDSSLAILEKSNAVRTGKFREEGTLIALGGR
jgi:hypothetical protein